MNWYKKQILIKESEWKWNRFLGSFGITTILGISALYNLGLLDLQNLYSKNPEKVEQMAQVYISQSKENELIHRMHNTQTNTPINNTQIDNNISKKENIKPPEKQEINSSSIDLDKIYEIESSSGKNPNAFKPNRAGALGHFQFLKNTWDECVGRMGKNWDWETGANDYNKSRQVADFYLNKRIPQMLNYYNIPDTVKTRLGAYNWGIGFVKKAYEQYGDNWADYSPTETKNYIQKYYN